MRIITKFIGIVIIVAAVFFWVGLPHLSAASLDCSNEVGNIEVCCTEAESSCCSIVNCPVASQIISIAPTNSGYPAALNDIKPARVSIKHAANPHYAQIRSKSRDSTKEFPEVYLQLNCRNNLYAEEPPLIYA
jgi:hypothetical protein